MPVDLAVIGAGPAGISAALAALGHRIETTIVDEAAAPGGQVYRAVPDVFRIADPDALGPDFAIGEALRRALRASAAVALLEHRVWNVSAALGDDADQRFAVDTLGADGACRITARALVVAAGASERVVAFPGWTLPGVFGLAGATILLKSQQMLPGRRTLVCGVGPLLYAVAAAVIKAGGEVAAIVDLAARGEWLGAVPAMLGRPALLRQALLRKARVPVLFRHVLAEARGEGEVAEAVVRPIEGGESRTFAVDCVAVGHGLMPSTEIAGLLHARMMFDPRRGGWLPEHDIDGRTSVAGLYVAGDGGGIAGAAAAEHSGTLAGLAVACDLGRLDATAHEREAGPVRTQQRRTARFGAAMAGLMRARPELLAGIQPDTVVCRCEDIPRAQIDETIARGATTLNQLKSWTRCGMGPCQGRFCNDTAAALIAATTGDRVAVGQFTPRMPLRPIPVAQLVADFDYHNEVPPPEAVPA